MSDFVDPSAINRIEALAALLLDARRDGVALAPVADDLVPTSAEDANAVDDAVAARLGQPVRGWKIGCTSEHAQQLMGADGPFAGRVYAVHKGATSLAPHEFVTEPLLEGEFAFSLTQPLPARTDRSRQEVLDAVGAVHPAIEVAGGRYARFFGTPLNCLIADAGANTRLVVGEPVSTFDPGMLPTLTATMTVGDEVTGRGQGSDVLGDPVAALCWLVDHLGRRGIDLAAGALISTGTATQVSELPPGATATLTIDGLGAVSLERQAN